MAIILYGAVAHPEDPPGLKYGLKLRLRRLVYGQSDLLRWKKGDLSKLDFRNYDTYQSTNLGDVAVAETARLLISKNLNHTKFRSCNWRGLDKAISSIEAPNNLIIVPGGGYFMFSEAYTLSQRILDDLAIIKKNTGTKVILLGVGINREFPNTEALTVTHSDAVILEEFLSYVSHISVRDSFSKNILSDYSNKRISLTGDPALHLASLYDIGHFDCDEVRFKSGIKIGLNFSFHSATPAKLMVQNLEFYILALKKIQAITKCTFDYFIHYETELIIIKLIVSRGIHVNIVRGPLQNLLMGYAKMDIHIGGMLHSSIFAHSVDTPAIAIAYDVKHIGHFETLGVPENCLSAFDFQPDILVDRVKDVLKNLKRVRSNIKNKRNELLKLTTEFIFSCEEDVKKSNSN